MKMNTTRKVLLSGTAMAVAAIGNPAFAQAVVGNVGAPPVVVAVDNGGTTCANGTTTGGYITPHAPADSQHVASQPNPPGPDYTDSTICTDQTATSTYTNTSGSALVLAPVDSTGESDLLIVDDSGTAVTTGNQATEQTTHYDTTSSPAVQVGVVTTTTTPISGTTVGNYTYTNSTETLQDTLYEATTTVSGTGATGTGTQTENLVTTGNIWMEQTTGTSSFDPVSGNVSYTPTDGTTTQLNMSGLHMSTLTGGNTETINYGVDGIHNGTSYVDVNPGNVVIHGGTTSTTVTVANNGVQITDSTNGNTLLVDNTGAIINNGTQHGGAVYVNDFGKHG